MGAHSPGFRGVRDLCMYVCLLISRLPAFCLLMAQQQTVGHFEIVSRNYEIGAASKKEDR